MIEHVIPQTVKPLPLEKYIRRAWPMLLPSTVKRLMDKRDVKINGVRCNKASTVAGGDSLLLYVPDDLADFSLQVTFNDGRIIAAVKPQGLPVDIDGDGIGADTL
ncbi:MAG: hypothetical protein MJ099_05240, partial [Clostridia bacterium]|nr:hypothetical protein [Clostridia bacterium]